VLEKECGQTKSCKYRKSKVNAFTRAMAMGLLALDIVLVF